MVFFHGQKQVKYIFVLSWYLLTKLIKIFFVILPTTCINSWIKLKYVKYISPNDIKNFINVIWPLF